MRQLVLGLLVSLFGLGGMFPGTDIEEAFKLPALVHHYQEHKAEAGKESISFLDFLAQHYGPDAATRHKGDDHEHDQLPMVKHLNHLSEWVIPEIIVPQCTLFYWHVQVPKHGLYFFSISQEDRAVLLQPPSPLV